MRRFGKKYASKSEAHSGPIASRPNATSRVRVPASPPSETPEFVGCFGIPLVLLTMLLVNAFNSYKASTGKSDRPALALKDRTETNYRSASSRGS